MKQMQMSKMEEQRELSPRHSVLLIEIAFSWLYISRSIVFGFRLVSYMQFRIGRALGPPSNLMTSSSSSRSSYFLPR